MDSPNFKVFISIFIYQSAHCYTEEKETDEKSMPFHFHYLMHNVAHKILISHTGQLQVYGNVRGDIGDGGHSLQGYRKR